MMKLDTLYKVKARMQLSNCQAILTLQINGDCPRTIALATAFIRDFIISSDVYAVSEPSVLKICMLSEELFYNNRHWTVLNTHVISV